MRYAKKQESIINNTQEKKKQATEMACKRTQMSGFTKILRQHCKYVPKPIGNHAPKLCMMIMSHQRQNINKTEIIKENLIENLDLQTKIIKTKNSLEGMKNRFERAKGRISELGERLLETMPFEEQRGGKRMKKSEKSLSEKCVTSLNTPTDA